MPLRLGWVVAVAACCLFASACGSDAATTIDKTGAVEKGVIDKTGSSSSSSAASKAATGKKLSGSVCQLLTVAEVEAVLKSGQTLTTYEEPPSADTDRSCSYVFGQGFPVLVISLQGELEPLDWNGLKAVPGSKAVAVRGAEGLFVSMVNVMYVQKNGLAVAIQIVATPANETFESASAKLAQSIGERLP